MKFALLISALFFMNNIHAQSASENLGMLSLNGKITDEQNRGMQAQILIYQNGAQVDSIHTSSNGKVEINLSLQDSVVFAVTSEGYVSKTVWINTRVPDSLQTISYKFLFNLDLYPVGKIPSNIDLERPIGQIVFSGTEFVYDTQFTKDANDRLKEFVKERKGLRVRTIEEQ